MFNLALGKKGDKLSKFGVVLFSGAVSGFVQNGTPFPI